jgi:hypothetical protein
MAALVHGALFVLTLQIAAVSYDLKVMSSELDPAESRLIPQNFSKGNVTAGF